MQGDLKFSLISPFLIGYIFLKYPAMCGSPVLAILALRKLMQDCSLRLTWLHSREFHDYEGPSG